ncbi:uncharacterized protein LOC144643786 [Oculina patagonica]
MHMTAVLVTRRSQVLNKTMPTIYSDGELRFFRLAKGVIDYSTAALRKVFIQEWNSLHQSTPWRNNSTSGSQLLTEERMRTRKSRLYHRAHARDYQPIKDNLFRGNVEEWDVTTLVFALKYSRALSQSRSSERGRRLLNAIDQLKDVRNSLIAHASKPAISQSKFKRNIDILLQAVEVLVTNSDPLVEKLQMLRSETEFLTEDLVSYKQWLKDDHDNLLLLEKDLERLQENMKSCTCRNDTDTQVAITSGSSEATGNSEIFLRIRTRVAKLAERPVTSVDLVPSRSRPEIFHSTRYINMMNKSDFLGFNFRWAELVEFLKGFSNDVDIKLFAGIQQAAALSHCSKKNEALEVVNSLIPKALLANNGVLIHARIKTRKALLLHDLGNDDEAMREADEAEMMLSLGACYEDIAEVNNAKANIILSSSKNSKRVQEEILFRLEKSFKSCGKATVDKSASIAQVTLRKALVHLGYYQHGILEDVTPSDVDIAETVLNRIAQHDKTMTERSKIYYTYSQSLLAYRKGDKDRAEKLEQKARRKCELHDLHNEIQQLDLLRSLIRPQPVFYHNLFSILFLVLLSFSLALLVLQ